MSKFCVYIKLELYLKQFLGNSLGYPVEFPVNSNENAVLRTFLQRLPPGRIPDIPTDEDTAIFQTAKPNRRSITTILARKQKM